MGSHLQDLWSNISPTIQIPSWLESSGSAKQSCQRICQLSQTLDFQVRYFVTQTHEVISWLQQRLVSLAEALTTIASRLTKLELLVYTIDTDLVSAEEKLLWVPQRNVQPKKQPGKKQPRPSSVVKHWCVLKAQEDLFPAAIPQVFRHSSSRSPTTNKDS